MHFAEILGDSLVPVEVELADRTLRMRFTPFGSAYVPGTNVSNEMV